MHGDVGTPLYRVLQEKVPYRRQHHWTMCGEGEEIGSGWSESPRGAQEARRNKMDLKARWTVFQRCSLEVCDPLLTPGLPEALTPGISVRESPPSLPFPLLLIGTSPSQVGKKIAGGSYGNVWEAKVIACRTPGVVNTGQSALEKQSSRALPLFHGAAAAALCIVPWQESLQIATLREARKESEGA